MYNFKSKLSMKKDRGKNGKEAKKEAKNEVPMKITSFFGAPANKPVDMAEVIDLADVVDLSNQSSADVDQIVVPAVCIDHEEPSTTGTSSAESQDCCEVENEKENEEVPSHGGRPRRQAVLNTLARAAAAKALLDTYEGSDVHYPCPLQ